MKFSELELNPQILKGLGVLGFEEATEVQEKTIPLVLAKKDVVVRSQTGSGKTFSFVLPILQNTTLDIVFPETLIVCPTRELTLQVSEEVKKITGHMEGIKVATIFGGASITRQIETLRKKPQIIVGTPGRILDHIGRKTLKLHYLKTVVLDEADEMLNMGFKEDIEKILESVPKERQTLLFSATYPEKIKHIVKNYLVDSVKIEIGQENKSLKNISQTYVIVNKAHKTDALLKILDSKRDDLILIFSNTKSMADTVAQRLIDNGHDAEALHGDLRQGQRRVVIDNFKFGKTKILVASDVAARGLDINNIDYVINYDIPSNLEYFLHRMGRTARAGKNGNAITIITTNNQRDLLESFEKQTESKITQVSLEGFVYEEVQGGNEKRGSRGSFGRRDNSDRRGNSERRPNRDRKPSSEGRNYSDRKPSSERREFSGKREYSDRKPSSEKRDFSDRKPRFDRKEAPERKEYVERLSSENRDYSDRKPSFDRKPRSESREFSDRKPNSERREFAGKRDYSDRKPSSEGRSYSDRKPSFDRKPYSEGRSYSDRKPSSEGRSYSDRKSSFDRKPSSESREFGGKREYSDRKSSFDRKPSSEGRSYSDRKPSFDRKPSSEGRSYSDRKPSSERRDFSDRKPRSESREFAGKREYSDRKPSFERKPSSEGRSYSDRKPRSESREFAGKREYSDRKPSSEGRDFSDRKPSSTRKEYKSFGASKDKKPFQKSEKSAVRSDKSFKEKRSQSGEVVFTKSKKIDF